MSLYASAESRLPRANGSRVLAEKESLLLECSPWSQYKQRTLRRYAVSPNGQPLCHRVHLRPERKVIRDPSEHLLTLDISESKCRKAIHAAAQEGAICNHSVPDGIKADCATKARVFLDRFCPRPGHIAANLSHITHIIGKVSS